MGRNQGRSNGGEVSNMRKKAGLEGWDWEEGGGGVKRREK